MAARIYEKQHRDNDGNSPAKSAAVGDTFMLDRLANEGWIERG